MAINNNNTTIYVTEPWKSFQNQNDPSSTRSLKGETSIFIYNKNTGEHVSFNLVPDSLQETYKPRFVSESGIYGRSTPLYFYIGGDDKTLSFSFSIHEDLLQGYSNNFSSVNRNIYTFLDKIKEFSRPVIKNEGRENQTLVPPQVYLQIGRQFAGTGFITTGWNYTVPYRDGRYIKVDMSVSFTYQLEYNSPKASLYDGADILIDKSLMFELSSNLVGVGGTKRKLEDLLPEYLDYEYMRTHVYGDIKAEEIALSGSNFTYTVDGSGALGITLKNTIYNEETGIFEGNELGRSIMDRVNIVTSRGAYFALLDYYKRELVGTMNPAHTPSSRTKALNNLYGNVKELEKTFISSDGKWILYYGSYGGDPRIMSNEDKKLFRVQLKEFYIILDTQFIYLENMIGASEQ